MKKPSAKRPRRPRSLAFIEIDCNDLARTNGYYAIGPKRARLLIDWLTRYLAWAEGKGKK